MLFLHAFWTFILSRGVFISTKTSFSILNFDFFPLIRMRVQFFFRFVLHLGSQNEISLYSSNEISGNESNEAKTMTESERQADFIRQKEEMKIKRRKKKRTSSSMQSSTFKGMSNRPAFTFCFSLRLFVCSRGQYVQKHAPTCTLRNGCSFSFSLPFAHRNVQTDR